MHLHEPCLTLPLVCQSPTSQDYGTCRRCEIPFARERRNTFCLLACGLPLSTQLMQHRGPGVGPPHSGGMGGRVGDGERLLVALQRPGWIAERPEQTGAIRKAGDASCIAVFECLGVLPCGIVEGHPLLPIG